MTKDIPDGQRLLGVANNSKNSGVRGDSNQVGEITWPCHVTGVLTPQFSSDQALNPYAIFRVSGNPIKKNKAGVLFFLGDI